MYYFDSCVEGTRSDEQTSFLLQRYSYRPPAELYHLASDPEELNNLAGDPRFSAQRQQLSALLEKELTRQGETTEQIKKGHFPLFLAHSYELPQGEAAFHLSFDKERWDPDTLFVSGYLQGEDFNGVICRYFLPFTLRFKDGKIALAFISS